MASNIEAGRYNSMQSKIRTVLGNGSGEFGYGQVLLSRQVRNTPPVDTVTAQHMDNLKADVNIAEVHQTNLSTTLSEVAVTDQITEAVYAEYEAKVDTIYSDKNLVHPNRVTAESKASSVRSAPWGTAGPIRHEFTVTFAGGYQTTNTSGNNILSTGTDHRRHFFNAGGEIRFSASATGGSGVKFNDWVTMLSNMGMVKFNYTTATATGSGTSFNLGNFDLTSSYQTVFEKYGSGLYSQNYIRIQAKGAQNTSVITFLVIFDDASTGGLDESVVGTITSTITQLRPTGSYVSVPTPTYQTTINLSS
jgi:hypothetical protein